MDEEIILGVEPHYETPQDLLYVVENYFNDTPRSEWTMGGLAFAIGIDIAELRLWVERDSEYRNVMRQAMTLLGSEYEKDLRKRGKGDVFAMKQFGWTDRAEVAHSHSVVRMGDVRVDGRELDFNVGKPVSDGGDV